MLLVGTRAILRPPPAGESSDPSLEVSRRG
jgi:hypothetical protein